MYDCLDACVCLCVAGWLLVCVCLCVLLITACTCDPEDWKKGETDRQIYIYRERDTETQKKTAVVVFGGCDASLFISGLWTGLVVVVVLWVATTHFKLPISTIISGEEPCDARNPSRRRYLASFLSFSCVI